MKIYDAQGARQIDAVARETLAVSGVELMSRAAHAALNALMLRFPTARSLSVWCGKGNNAGDAWLLASAAVALGLRVQLVGVEPRTAISGDALKALVQAEHASLVLEPFSPDVEIVGDVIVDGLLGTGFHGALRAPFSAAIAKVNTAKQPIVALDVPSGVNASTGGVSEMAIAADLTVTFITHKVGLHTGAGPSYAGEVQLATLSVPEFDAPQPKAEGLFARPHLLAAPTRQTYKHAQGHVLVVGGAPGMAGAVALTGEAALRAGAGLVSVVTADSNHAGIILSRRPELMVLDAANSDWQEKLATADVVVLGPGLGREAWGLGLYQQVAASGTPTVLDADGLFHLANDGRWQGGPLFITPHVGEAARLLQTQGTQVEQDRLAAVAALATKFTATVALKGAGTVVGSQGVPTPLICQHGNPGMATAGMGDVLAGFTGGLLASLCRAEAPREELDRVFAQAVALHSAAADYAAAKVGQRSLIASDVINTLPQVLSAAAEGVLGEG